MRKFDGRIRVLAKKIGDSSETASLDELHAWAKELRSRVTNFRKKQNHLLVLTRGINAQRIEPYYRIRDLMIPNLVELVRDQYFPTEFKDHYKCYVCKTKYNKVHEFYHLLCPECAELNFTKRSQTSNLTGKIAVVTGGRIKIGFETCLKLLRAGATVITTTRFSRDAMRRYLTETDYEQWKHLLIIYQLDFLDLDSVRYFIQYVNSFGRLDILINNAAQTIERPHELCIVADSFTFDTRSKNTWIQPLSDTNNTSLTETTIINYMVPFTLMNGFHKLLARNATAESPSFVINVSAVEGKFTTGLTQKTDRHVHTNCAKAALNMITRTVAYTWKQRHIYVNSIDTGWITNEFPISSDAHSKKHDLFPPLDEIDGAARVLDLIFNTPKEGIWGLFLKDYFRTSW